jgi:diadenosine tetraphosphate (Ap4A) HIT family hydrolase
MGRRDPYRCGACGFELRNHVGDLSASQVGLFDDARFPGRSLVVYESHVEDVNDLSFERASAFFEDCRRAGRAIASATGAERINYAILGNAEPHLHCHVIPRRPDLEPRPDRPPWEDPRPQVGLGAERVTALIGALRAALDLGLDVRIPPGS